MVGIIVSGAVSNVDSATIITSLVSVQQNQQKLLQAQQAKQQKAADSYTSLITSLKSLSAQAKSLATVSDWKGATTSSSSTSVSATSTSNTESAVTFDVTALAKAHAVISAESVSGLDAVVASSPGAVTVTSSDGTTVAINAGSGSLADVVKGINASGAAVGAAAIRTGAGQYRLQITSTTTGAASTFSIDGLDGAGGVNVLTEGSDAQVTIGSDPLTAFTASSATNTFTDLVPGLSFTVRAVENAVTVRSTLDGSAVAGDVQKLVDAANAVLSGISAATAYSPTAGKSGPLVGDTAARSLQQGILGLIGSAGAPGVSLTRDGKLSFDATAFSTAYAKDPAAVAARFGAGVTFTPASGITGTVSFAAASSLTKAGTYPVTVSAVAEREQWQLDGAAWATGSVISLARGDQSVSYTVQPTDTPADVLTRLNQRITSAGFGVGTQLNGDGSITATADALGSAAAFTLAVDGVAQQRITAGADVSGTIDGQAAVGSGTLLTLSGTASRAGGLAMVVDLTAADVAATGGEVGTIEYSPGLAKQLSAYLDAQTATGTGTLSSAAGGRESAVKTYQKQIDAWDARLTAYRATLQTQFTAMETAIAKLKSQSSSLTNSLNSLSSSSTSSG